MNPSDLLSQFPHSIPSNSDPSSLSYVRVPDYYAIHGQVPPDLRPSVLEFLNDQSIALLQGTVTSNLLDNSSIKITPVYWLEPNGAPAVPTGRIFIRFEDYIHAEEKCDVLKTIGYQVVDIPSYASHTAWIRAESESIAASLSNTSRLHSISDVRHFEPQMLKALRYRLPDSENKGREMGPH